MAFDIEQVNASIQQFNEKYKFSQKAKDYIDVFTTQQDYNYMYVSTLEWMVGEVCKRIDQVKDFEVHQMVADFEQYVMSGLRRYAEENELYPASEAATHPGRIPDPLAGMTEKAILGRLDQKLAGMEWEKVDDLAKEYMAGELPIREMKNFSKSLILSDSESNLKVARQIAGFSAALTMANQSRSFFWAIRHPVRFFAERRYAAQFKKMIEDNLALEEKFEHYLDEFKAVPEHVSLMRKQIDAKLNNPAKTADFIINPEGRLNEANSKNIIGDNSAKHNNQNKEINNPNNELNNNNNELNNNNNDLNKSDSIINDEEEVMPPLGMNEYATGRFDEMWASNQDFSPNLATGINKFVQWYAKENPNTNVYGRLSEEIFGQIIQGSISGCQSPVWDICEKYDNYRDNEATVEELNSATKTGIESMFVGIIGSFNGINIPLKDKIVLTQMTIDKFLKKFSPTGYDRDTLGRFGENYMIRENSEFVKNHLETSLQRMKNGRPVTDQEKQEIAQALDGAREELGLRVNIGDSIDLNESTNENIIGKVDDNSLEPNKQLNNGNII